MKDEFKKFNEFKKEKMINVDVDLEKKIDTLLINLRDETALSSNPNDRFNNLNFKKIVEIGDDAILILFNKLKIENNIYIIYIIDNIMGEESFLKNIKYNNMKEMVFKFIEYFDLHFYNGK